MICEKCNANMNYFTEESSCGWTCPDCGWEIVTSSQAPWANDLTAYTLSVVANNTSTINDIKAISKAGNINSLESKKQLISGGVLKEGSASDIASAIQLLAKNNIAFTVTPEFPYNVD